MTKTAMNYQGIMIIKVGTTTMFRRVDGREILDDESFLRIGQQVLALQEQGYGVILVSSGAVTAGMEVVGMMSRPDGNQSMPETQRLATLGWHHILQRWENAVGMKHVGGLLVTRRELDLQAPEHDEVLRTAHVLLGHGDVPVLNENDAITHAELAQQSFGQNDELAAIFAAQVAGSSLFVGEVGLVLLSDIDGVYADKDDPTTVIHEIVELEEYAHVASDSASAHGTGGMTTKFEAARIAGRAGVHVWIANGKTPSAVQLTLNGGIGTHFYPSSRRG